MEILFLCTGNTCRSPMAKALTEKKLKDRGLESVTVRSAGTFAVEGAAATQEGIIAMQKKGIDTSKHRSKRVTNEDLMNADYIFAMDRHNYEYIEVKYPQYLDKTYMLSQYAELGYEIPDPYYLGQEYYDSCADTIESCVDVIIKNIEEDNM